MHHGLLRAQNYRNKAEELRAIAAGLKSPSATKLFLEMAADYIHMAEMLERMITEKEAPNADEREAPAKQFTDDRLARKDNSGC